MHKILKSFSLLPAFVLVFISITTFLFPTLKVVADSTYSYREVTVGGSADKSQYGLDICLEEYDANGDDKVLAIVEENEDLNDTYYWCEDERNTNKYIFVFNGFATGGAAGNGEGIFVNGASPDQGSRGLIGRSAITGDDAEAITISNTRPFTNLYSGATDQTTQDLADDIQTATDNTTAEAEAEAALANQSCEDAGGDFSFLLCPLLSGASDLILFVDEQIMKALDVGEEYYSNEGVIGAWRNFRNIAYIVLIPIMLVMVIGTALNFNFVDAYTVKRALPRLLAAVIFITLSFEITQFMVEISNVVGRGVGGLLASPFGGLDNLELTDIFTAAVEDDVAFTGGVLAGVGIAALSGVTVGSLFITVGLAALAIFTVFFLLILREMLIVFLIVLSPVAIIAWIFPGNDKPWKLWWQAFSKMLYFYPIVLGIIVIGRAFASIVEFTGADGVVITIIKLVAFVGPYFFIPKAFQFAGGALGNLAGMVNDREKGLFDRARKLRSGLKAEQRQQIKSGGGGVFGVGKNSDFGKKFGTAGSSVYGLGRAFRTEGISGLNKASMNAAADKNYNEAAAEAAEKDEDFKAFSADDNILKAIQALMDQGIKVDASNLKSELQKTDAQGNFVYGSRFGSDSIAQETAALVMQSKSKLGEQTFNRATLVAKAKAGTYFDDMGHMAREIAQVYGSDRMGAGGAIMALKGLSMQAGRADLGGGGAGATLGALQDTYDGKSSSEITKAYVNAALDSQPPGTFAHPTMKDAYIRDNVVPVMQERIQTAYDKMKATGDDSDYVRELAAAENLHNSLKTTKPSIAGLFGDQVMGYSPEAGRVLTAADETVTMTPGRGPSKEGPGELPREVRSQHYRTVRSESHAKSDDPRYQNYERNWQAQQVELNNRRALMDAQAAGPGGMPLGGGATPPPPV